jgi:hypothetical protein
MLNSKIILSGFTEKAFAQAGYKPLEPAIVGQTPGTEVQLKTFIYAAFTQFLIVCAVLAVIMIIYGGFLYITSMGGGAKSEAKKKIWGAIVGLILALISYALLYTINPQLVNYDPVLTPPTKPAQ